MDIKEVNSSNLKGLGYDAQAQTLLVVFKSGRRYLYSGVPELEYRALMAATVVTAPTSMRKCETGMRSANSALGTTSLTDLSRLPAPRSLSC